MASRRYGSFTPKRRAALKKAQIASAKKRSRRRKIVYGAVGATTVLAATVGAGYVGHRYTKALKGGPKRPHIPGKDLVHVPGHGVTFTRTEVRRSRKRGNFGKPHGHKVFVSSPTHGLTISRLNSDNSQSRTKYNSNRRRAYWQSKPIGKAVVISTAGSRKAGKRRSRAAKKK